MNKIIKITLSLILCITLLAGCGKKKETKNEEKQDIPQGNVNINTKEDVIGDKEVESFKFEKTSLTYDGEVSRLETKVTNISEEEQTIIEFRIHIIKDEVEIANLPGYIGSTLKAGESRILTTTYGVDITGATSINYEIIR